LTWVLAQPNMRQHIEYKIMIGLTISHYRIKSKLGEGGMGAVYSAEDLKLGRDVALKFLPETLASDANARRRLLVEAKLASRLNHPHIATIYEVNDSEGAPFLAMELVQGETLKQVLNRGALEPTQLLEIARQIAEGLREAVVHEDAVAAADPIQDPVEHLAAVPMMIAVVAVMVAVTSPKAGRILSLVEAQEDEIVRRATGLR